MLSTDPGPAPMLARRRVLVNGGRALLALTALGAVSTGCGSSPPPALDPLEAQLDLARRDSVLATAAAKAALPAIAPALLEVASERARHAAALVEEIARAAGKPIPSETSTTSESTTTPAQPTATTPPPPPPTLPDVVDSLRASADSATKLAPTLSGYRAGLLGSIAAACTTSYTVALPAGTRPR